MRLIIFNSELMNKSMNLVHYMKRKLKTWVTAGRNGGEYYTPRPLIKSIVKVIDPKVGETIYDGAVGSAGFLVEAFGHVKQSKSLTVTEFKKLQTKTSLRS